MLFVFQTASERPQEPSHQLQNTAVSFVWYKTPGDETTSISDKCRQQKDQSVALSNVLISNINDRENVDENEDDDVLCSLLSRNKYDVGRKTFSGAGDVVSVQQIDDDTETQNTCEQMTSKSRTTHTIVKLHRCDVCHNPFDNQSALKRHKRTHTGEKPFTCNVCHKGFAQQCSLKKHKRIHTGERPYTCRVCNSRFARLSTLKAHLTRHSYVHSGIRIYRCDQCRMEFVHETSFMRHMHTHAGEILHTLTQM